MDLWLLIGFPKSAGPPALLQCRGWGMLLSSASEGSWRLTSQTLLRWTGAESSPLGPQERKWKGAWTCWEPAASSLPRGSRRGVLPTLVWGLVTICFALNPLVPSPSYRGALHQGSEKSSQRCGGCEESPRAGGSFPGPGSWLLTLDSIRGTLQG